MMKDDLTKAQAAALRKWLDYGRPTHQKSLGINEGVFRRLRSKGFLQSKGFLVRYPSAAGVEALKRFEAKNAK